MKILSRYKEVLIQSLEVEDNYQRGIDQRKLKRLTESIRKNGYYPFCPIIITSRNKVIDGQHRMLAAENNNCDTIPACVVEPQNIVDEAQFFSEINMFDSRLKPVDFWHARYLHKHPLAMLVYELNNNKESKLYDRIAIKGHHSPRNKFSVAQVLNIMCIICLGRQTHWRLNDDETLTNLALQTDKIFVLSKMNHFATFFFDWAGESKPHAPLQYADFSMRAIALFYMKLSLIKESKEVRPNFWMEAVKKMQSFPFTQDWRKITHAARLNLLISHYNRKKTTNLIEHYS